MQKSKHIILPLTVGISSINKTPLQTISTVNLELQLSIKCKFLKSFYCQSTSKLRIKQIKYERQNIIMSCNDLNSQGQFDKQINLLKENENNICMTPFKISFFKQNQDIFITLERQIINISLFLVTKSRFVKNQRLQEFIEGKQQLCGPLSMDKSGRILLESEGTSFPVVGIWINSRQRISNSWNFSQIVRFLRQKISQKCFFNSENRKFFYLVKMNFQKNTPQLFLVEWKLEGKTQKKIEIEKKDIFTKVEIIINTDQKSGLEFTLRSDEKVPELLMNIPCSPIKFPNSDSLSETTKSSLPDSPRFKLDQSQIKEQQCKSLKILVKNQQIKINDLKSEILRLTSQLRQCKKHNHYCQNEDLSLSYTSHIRGLEDNKIKRLTRSDLTYQQKSQENQNINEPSNEEQDVWNQFQIIDK